MDGFTATGGEILNKWNNCCVTESRFTINE